MIKRYDIYAYCNRCGIASGTGAVEVEYEEDKNGSWVGYHDHVTSLNSAQQLKAEIAECAKILVESGALENRWVAIVESKLRQISAI